MTLKASNLIALSGLFFGFGMAMFAMQAQFEVALVCLLFAALVNLGTDPKQIVLNRLVAMCTCGFAPAIFAYCFGLRGTLSIALLIGYMGVCAARLAESDRGVVPISTVFLPLAFTTRFVLPDEWVRQILFVAYGLMIAAMLLPVPTRKSKGIAFAALIALLIAVYVWAIFR